MLYRGIALLFTAVALIVAISLMGKSLAFATDWAGFGINFDLRLDSFGPMILLVAAFTFLTILYSVVFMKGRKRERQFYAFVLLNATFITGALLANNLVLMLFFWEGILGVLFALILTGGAKASQTAIKALIINVTADFCLIIGVGVAAWQTGTLTMDIIRMPLDSFWNGFSFIMMMIGAVAKAGSMPFHTWIPDAATDAPLPFMAILPASLDKIAGIYLLARLNISLFEMVPGSGLSLAVMSLGACTILFAVLMALIQKDYKRLLSYHAISQVGYMVLGIGTALPIGIVGGIFHMVNNSLYKSCLFFTAGNVEKQVGTTDLKQLGGIGRKMPITFGGFLIAAAAISGVPPLNGFFSKELVFDAALEIHPVFFVIAAIGAFFTAASFLKLGHTVYFGKPTVQSVKAKEAPWPMLVPIVVLALACILFGVYNPLPLQGMIEPVLGNRLGHSFAGLPHNWLLAGISVGVLLLAVLNHFYGVKKSGKASGASDHIHYAPGLKSIFAWSEAGLLDPYRLCGKLLEWFSIALDAIDKAIDWVYMSLVTSFAFGVSRGINKADTGGHWLYVLWALAGTVAISLIFFVGTGG
ncbi:MAG: hypothetical protein FWE65_01340 [Eggerthellaceae bacterium]|nr:hypothetical protein [Eggerthellaceae bacterium]